MANTVFSRVLSPRNLINVNNGTAAILLNTPQRLPINSCTYATAKENVLNKLEIDENPQKNISKAMRAYLERAKQHDEFMKKEQQLYQIGKRHLANMMGENPETFTQEDVNKAIRYLFPSGLFEPKARPVMYPPEKLFPLKKEAAFDESGRPFHSMFYTFKPNYYEMLYNIADQLQKLDKLEDKQIKKGFLPEPQKVDLVGSLWLTQDALEKILLENLNEKEYNYFLSSMERLADHPMSKHATELIMKYRKNVAANVDSNTIQPIEYDAAGRPYVIVKNCMRKSARGEVTIWGQGSGKITINGKDITYFDDMQAREQVSLSKFFISKSKKISRTYS